MAQTAATGNHPTPLSYLCTWNPSSFLIHVSVVSQPHYSVVRGLVSIEAVGTRYALEMEPSSREGCSRTSVLSNLRTPDEVKEAELPKLQLTIKNDRER